MAVQGKVRENNFESKEIRVGFVEGNVLCVNPTMEEFSDILGMELKEDSKAAEYLGESKDGNTTLRLDFWYEDVKTGIKDKITFFLDDEENLPDWFKKSDYRVAKQGEAEFYEFAKFWLAGLDTKDGGELSFSWKPLMKGNVKEIKEQVGGDFQKTVGLLLEVKTVDKD